MLRVRRRCADAGCGCPAGFTLIEVLVALAVVATSLAAIGSLVAVSIRGTQSIERRLALRETLRSIVASAPERGELVTGSSTGNMAGYAWRMDVAPYSSILVDPQARTPWEPAAVSVTVRSPSGQLIRIDTIRLRRRPG